MLRKEAGCSGYAPICVTELTCGPGFFGELPLGMLQTAHRSLLRNNKKSLVSRMEP
jgi:hypothetical protein